MADSICGEVEGDYSVVKVQLAGGGKDDKVTRPTKGTQLVWGGTDVSSPWGHLAALIDKSGGSVNYTYVHAADLKEPLVIVTDEPAAPDDGGADAPADDKPAAAAASDQKPAGTPSAGGAEGHGPLFDIGVDFQFGGNTARVWAHPHAFMAGPRPLVIALHGINGTSRKLHPALDGKAVHVGKLANQLIEDGKVTPLIIAAPTEFSDGPWRSFDIAKFVDAVKAAVAAQSVEIDLDDVSVVGHSGAGGSPGAGLNKIASEGGVFAGHKLKVFGITDTCITDANAKAYADGLAKNDTTAIYAMHKGTGGWVAYSSSRTFAAALGASTAGKATEPPEDGQDVEDAWDNGGKKPLRVSLKIKTVRLAAHHKDWTAAGGYHVDVGAHDDMVPMWFSWALPRWFPATEEDKNAGLKPHPIEDPKPVEIDDKPTVSGGEWANVPPAADPWADPGIDPKSTGAALFAPATGLYWPVRNPKNHYGRAVCFIGSDGKGYGVGKSAGGRNFLAGRPADGNPDRFHAGIDVFGDHHDVIVACEAGEVVNAYPFYPTPNALVWCLIVQHDSGVVINYGEVDPASLKKYGMKKGVKVQPGQPIAEVGRMVQDSMLHFETYPSGTKQNISYKKSQGEAFLKNFFNPTQYLLALAKNGK